MQAAMARQRRRSYAVFGAVVVAAIASLLLLTRCDDARSNPADKPAIQSS
jgi:hypothetical protein